MEKKEHYGALDGIRTYSAIGIVFMHVLANGNYDLDGFVFDKLIPSFANLVFLFMVISGFSMSCGYYSKIINNEISVEKFYSKRYTRILPYFAFLCILDLRISPSLNSVIEAFANLTLCFGLLPNADISVIGVGWFLGVVFVFYLLFPFFCYLISNKRRAWVSFLLALIFNIVCGVYFFDSKHMLPNFSHRSNFIYCAVYFMAGGLIFLHKEQIKKVLEKCQWIILILCVPVIFLYYVIGENTIIYVVMFSLFLIYAVASFKEGILSNTIVKFISSISMEVYLSHMLIFRILEKIHFLHIFESNFLSYFVVATITLCGAIVFSITIRKIFNKFSDLYKNKICKRIN